MEATTGVHPPVLDHPDLPDAAFDAWHYWNELNSGRFNNGMSVTPLSWMEIEAWGRLCEHALTYTELQMVRTIDAEYIKRQSTKNTEN